MAALGWLLNCGALLRFRKRASLAFSLISGFGSALAGSAALKSELYRSKSCWSWRIWLLLLGLW